MKLPKKIMTAALLIVSLFMTGCGSQVNIGYVDGAKIIEEAPQIKAILEESEKKIEEIQNEATAKLDENPDWTDEEKNAAMAELQRKIMGINQAYSTQLKYKFDEAISGIAAEKKLDVVVDSSENQPTVLMGGIDVTDEVIKKLQ